jgi:hydrogenase/urease accessory protein HupE
MRHALGLAALLATAGAAHAHPGHGPDGGGNGLLHHLTQPDHLAPILFAVAVAAIVVVARRRRAR